jgi:hypothetical protein
MTAAAEGIDHFRGERRSTSELDSAGIVSESGAVVRCGNRQQPSLGWDERLHQNEADW